MDSKLVKKFRDQIHALGALWIILGSVRVGLSGAALVGAQGELNQWVGLSHPALWIVLGIEGLIDISIGVLTCLKHLWAVYLGLVLTYLSLLSLLVSNWCAALVIVIVILQAHRVIGWARQMRAAGVPLTAKPQ
jgi:hypothetical protein